MVISKNCEICSEIKFEIENVQHLRQKLWAENFESKILSEFKLNKQEDREMGDSQRLLITKKAWLLNGWVDGWMGGL